MINKLVLMSLLAFFPVSMQSSAGLVVVMVCNQSAFALNV
jgi:hypothetical protein